MIYLLAGIISLAQGFFLTAWLLGPQSTVSTAWMLFAGLLAGLGLSGLLTFTSFLFFQELVPAYAIAVNILALFLLFFLAFKSRTGINLRAFFGQQPALKAKGARNAAPASAAHKPVNSINILLQCNSDYLVNRPVMPQMNNLCTALL